MNQNQHSIDQKALNMLEERLKRGIPKWEQGHFIEQVVPQLVARLKQYMDYQPRS